MIEDSLQVVDAALKVTTPFGPRWRRSNHDGYGQREESGPDQGWGKGRAWPWLTGERGHDEVAAGREAGIFMRAREAFGHALGLLPEPVWDEPDGAVASLPFGRPTGSAMPLMWAHAESIKLLRSVSDGQVFDLIPALTDRDLKRRVGRALQFGSPLIGWKRTGGRDGISRLRSSRLRSSRSLSRGRSHQVRREVVC